MDQLKALSSASWLYLLVVELLTSPPEHEDLLFRNYLLNLYPLVVAIFNKVMSEYNFSVFILSFFSDQMNVERCILGFGACEFDDGIRLIPST